MTAPQPSRSDTASRVRHAPSPFTLGSFGGLRLSAEGSALYATLLLWVVAALCGALLLKLSLPLALLGALLIVLAHWLSALAHQLGHAFVARRLGRPMVGIRFWLLLSTALYPDDEPELPAAIHIRRALGGPLASLALTLASVALALALRLVGGPLWWVAVFLVVDNLAVFTLGAFLPLGFTDGSTLLYWLPRR